MSDIAIKVENLGKKYQIHHDTHGKTHSIREALAAKFSSLINPSKHARYSTEDFWALKEVSFEIKKGECVGIVGRNGAGKSTLLKALSRITEPTTGRIELHGRVASLLEVGTGFHQELSGRENIYLNGTILGMTKKEIDRKFDEIVDYAGIEKFLDTPVKRYSSGMYVRLAFAVAAHLESEIVVVDEVLAVGDAQFQEKCLGTMKNISEKQNRTVLFVSHNMGAVKKLCNRGILLQEGIKKNDGEISEILDEYAGRVSTEKSFSPFRIKDLDVVVEKISFNQDSDGIIVPFKPLKIDIEMEASREVKNISIELMLSRDDVNGFVFLTNTKSHKNIDLVLKKGKNKVSCLIHHFNVCSGQYCLGLAVDMPYLKYYYYELALLKFNVPESLIEPGVSLNIPSNGHFYLQHDWLVKD